MIWLQYDDPENDTSGEYDKHIYPDDAYEEALAHYQLLKVDWDRTRILFENNDDTKDWVIIQADNK